MSHYHRVVHGECLSQIAQRAGFADYRIIYDHSQNAEFRRKRPDPNIIFAGDQLFIPDRQEKSEQVTTGLFHLFRVKTAKVKLHLRMRDDQGEPLRNTPYVLTIGDDRRERKTDGDGLIDEEIPVFATDPTLEIDGVVCALQVGDLNPLEDVGSDVSGVQARLKNLGYDPGTVDGALKTQTETAIREFQEDHEMEVDGKISPAFLDKLESEYGS